MIDDRDPCNASLLALGTSNFESRRTYIKNLSEVLIVSKRRKNRESDVRSTPKWPYPIPRVFSPGSFPPLVVS
jgi:hypothetical protein